MMYEALSEPSLSCESTLRLSVVSGVQAGLHHDFAAQRLRIGFNCDSEDIELFTAELGASVVELKTRDQRAVLLHVSSGRVSLNGTTLSEGAQAIVALSQSFELNGVDITLSRPQLNRGTRSTVRGKRAIRWAQICVSFVCGAVTINHPHGVAQTTFVSAINPRNFDGPTSSTPDASLRIERAVQAFAQQAYYLGHTELTLAVGAGPGEVIATGYVKSRNDLDRLKQLAIESSVKLDMKVVPVDTLGETVQKAIALTAPNTVIEYSGTGMFRISTTRQHRAHVHNAALGALASSPELRSIWLVTTDSHRALDREIGVEIERGSAALAEDKRAIEDAIMQTEAIPPRTMRYANGFKSYSVQPGHRIYTNEIGDSMQVNKR